ncbi:helix-turn-helix transcriptional regulator [Promicromonospora sp. MEB111]|uniref:helix-turn-helix domain-containing protein n=1 Tax=Promicromonospora sp. MEB111 TaxID=3040301 RepID=UPI00254D8795|nr:helix-turn-helix transcriptional regulator [Promicromonospora sp. MEB111]
MTDLAENLARLRKAKDLSQESLAERAGVGVDTVARIERGTRTTCRPATLHRLAAALSVSAQTLLTGEDNRQSALATNAEMVRLRQAITSGGLVPGLSDFAENTETVSLTEAERQTTAVWRLYVDGRHTELLALLPAVLADARRLVETNHGDDAAAGRRLLATTYRIAAGIAGRLGQDDLAWTAAERALDVARSSDDPELQQAVALRYLAWTLVRQGREDEAEQVATNAAEAIQPTMLDADPVRTAVFGNLLFNAATAAVKAGAVQRAADLLAEARSAAARTMTSVVTEAAIFSPRAVALQEVDHWSRSNDPETALHQAATLQSVPGQLPAFWEAGSALHIASASLKTRRYDDALHHLDQAHRLAPDWATSQPLGVTTMRALLDRATRRRGPRFAGLAQAFGVA